MSAATLAPELTYVTNEMWVEALRSGKYQQCHGVAAEDSEGVVRGFGAPMAEIKSFCCLTVQAHLAGRSDVGYLGSNEAELNNFTLFGAADLLALDIWTNAQRAHISGRPAGVGFVFLNDTVKASFEQIADVIEQVEPIA